MVSGPEIDEVVAARVPLPENPHVGNSGTPPGTTVNVADVSWAPEIVPVSAALTIWPSPTSMSMGPETVAPLWVAVQELT